MFDDLLHGEGHLLASFTTTSVRVMTFRTRIKSRPLLKLHGRDLTILRRYAIFFKEAIRSSQAGEGFVGEMGKEGGGPIVRSLCISKASR